MILIVLDATRTDGENAFAEEMLTSTAGRPRIVVINKIDIAETDVSVFITADDCTRMLSTSALSGLGIAELRQAILDLISGNAGSAPEPGFRAFTQMDVMTAVSRLEQNS